MVFLSFGTKKVSMTRQIDFESRVLILIFFMSALSRHLSVPLEVTCWHGDLTCFATHKPRDQGRLLTTSTSKAVRGLSHLRGRYCEDQRKFRVGPSVSSALAPILSHSLRDTPPSMFLSSPHPKVKSSQKDRKCYFLPLYKNMLETT